MSRQKAAQDREAERQAFLADPLVQAIQRQRACLADLTSAKGLAAQEWHRHNDPVRCPVSGRPQAMHPQKAAAMQAFLDAQGWGDWAEPIEPTEPLESIVERVTAEAQAAHDEASRIACELQGITYEPRTPRVKVAALVGEAEIAAACATYGDDDPVSDESIRNHELPRRRGRPRLGADD